MQPGAGTLSVPWHHQGPRLSLHALIPNACLPSLKFIITVGDRSELCFRLGAAKYDQELLGRLIKKG